MQPDNIRFNDSLRFVTPEGKIVYGGGGIMPDIVVPVDTNIYSIYYTIACKVNQTFNIIH